MLFLFFLYTFNTPWSWIEFPRFSAPTLPVALFYLDRFLPTDIRIKTLLVFITSIVFGLSAVGIRNVFPI